MNGIALLLCFAVPLTTVYTQNSAAVPCNCTYKGAAPTTTDTPQQRSNVCSAAQEQLMCFKSCDTASQSDVTLLTNMLEQNQCGAASNILSLWMTTVSAIITIYFV